jgi:hypothetical protein
MTVLIEKYPALELAVRLHDSYAYQWADASLGFPSGKLLPPHVRVAVDAFGALGEKNK